MNELVIKSKNGLVVLSFDKYNNEIWEKFCLSCPWSKRQRSRENTPCSCRAIRWANGEGRKCSIEFCAPFHFIKTLVQLSEDK